MPSPGPKLLVVQSSSIFERYGGIESYLDDLLYMAARTFGPQSVRAVFPIGVNAYPAATDPAARPYRRIPVTRSRFALKRKIENRFSVPLLQTSLRECRRERPDFLVCGHVSLGPLTYLLHRLTGIPFVACAYGLECWGDMFAQDDWCLRRAHGIISISHWTKQRLVANGLSDSRIRVVQPMLPKDFEDLSSPNRRTSSDAGPLRLLTVSRLDAQERYKGHDHVLEALAKLAISDPDLTFRYRIHGDGSDRERLRTRVQELKLGAIVTFSNPSKDRNGLAEVYRSSDLFVMPSRFGRWGGRWRGEGFGIVYLEAAAFGVASVAYRCGGVTDIITDGVNGKLIVPDDVDALARELRKLANDRRSVITMGDRAYSLVMSQFTERTIQSQLTDAFAYFRSRADRANPIRPESPRSAVPTE